MNKDDLKKFRESLGMSQQDISLLFGLAQPAWNRYEKGSRPIPEYVQRSIDFFQALSKRSQQQFINTTRPDGEQCFAADEEGRV